MCRGMTQVTSFKAIIPMPSENLNFLFVMNFIVECMVLVTIFQLEKFFRKPLIFLLTNNYDTIKPKKNQNQLILEYSTFVKCVMVMFL